MEALGGDEARVRERAEFLRFQLDEINRLEPGAGRGRASWTPSAGGWPARRSSSARRAEAELLLSGEESSALETVGRALGLLSEAVQV